MIKPCPVCGHEGIQEYDSNLIFPYAIRCSNCYFIAQGSCEDLAIQEWHEYEPELSVSKINHDIQKLKEPGMSVGEISDGYHTFNELYDHRAHLFAMIVRQYPDVSWKSWLHYDGTMFEGMFVVGITTPEGQYTYHYSASYWDLFECQELPYAPEYDGHQPEDIKRLFSLPKRNSKI